MAIMSTNRGARRWLSWVIPAVAVAALAALLWPTEDKLEKVASSKPVHPARIGDAGTRHKPKSVKQLPTTDGAIWLENMDGVIAELERLVKAKPEIIQNVQKLASAHHLRGRFKGDLDEIQLGIDYATQCMKVETDEGNCVLMRAEQEQSLHRFKDARADLAIAKGKNADPIRVADLEAELDFNDGLYEKAFAQIKKARQERPSTPTLIRQAQLDYDLELDADGETAFELAEDAIHDTTPFPVAHLNLQRGIQLMGRGKLEEAIVFFREAVLRLPTYIAANEHLAEALHRLGRDEEATTIYEKVVRLSDDPEFQHALAELYEKRGQSEEAKALEAKARAGYEKLLGKYPEAMYWHASEFFMSIGEKKRALELLQKNVELRPNSTSYVALARAQLANGLVAEATASIDKALAMPVRSASLFWTASLVKRQAGNAAEADALRDRAKKLNPRIDEDEPDPTVGSP